MSIWICENPICGAAASIFKICMRDVWLSFADTGNKWGGIEDPSLFHIRKGVFKERMLNWSKNLYYGEQAKKKATRIRWRAEHRKAQYEVYLITLAQNPENQLEILNANQLLQTTVYRRCPKIIGIACGYGEALDMIQDLAQATYDKQKDGDIRRYLGERQEDEGCM